MNLIPVKKRNTWFDPFDMMNRFFNRNVPAERNEQDFWTPYTWDFPFSMGGLPAVDVEETEKDVIVRAEIPGMEKDEFSIELKDNTLVLRGEKKRKTEEKKRNYHHVECSYGQFERHISLPSDVENDKGNAEYKNGVLTVTLPKSESAQRKKIDIKFS